MSLSLISRRPVDIAAEAPVLLSVVRNEALRLPYFLSYYRSIGFDRFIVVDNDSTDGTRELLLAQPDIFVFHTSEHFGAPPGAGLDWKHALLDRYCDGRWVLVVDADEILVWPDSERDSIRALASKLESFGGQALFTLMVDMYSDKPFGEIGYRAGEPFIDYAPYFDPGPIMFDYRDYCPFIENWGGVRYRYYAAAGKTAGHPPTVSKVPFLRWRAGQRFRHAQHFLTIPVAFARLRGVLLHFKMFDDLPGKCESEAAHGEYYRQGQEYRILGEAIRNLPNRSFYDPAISLRYEGPDQLVALKMMRRFAAPGDHAYRESRYP